MRLVSWVALLESALCAHAYQNNKQQNKATPSLMRKQVDAFGFVNVDGAENAEYAIQTNKNATSLMQAEVGSGIKMGSTMKTEMSSSVGISSTTGMGGTPENIFNMLKTKRNINGEDKYVTYVITDYDYFAGKPIMPTRSGNGTAVHVGRRGEVLYFNGDRGRAQSSEDHTEPQGDGEVEGEIEIRPKNIGQSITRQFKSCSNSIDPTTDIIAGMTKLTTGKDVISEFETESMATGMLDRNAKADAEAEDDDQFPDFLHDLADACQVVTRAECTATYLHDAIDGFPKDARAGIDPEDLADKQIEQVISTHCFRCKNRTGDTCEKVVGKFDQA